MKKSTIAIVTVLVVLISMSIMPELEAATSKEKLMKSIAEKQMECEKKIVNMWMAGERGVPLENELSEYVALEVRLRAFAKNKGANSLIVSVSENPNYKPDNPIDLGRQIVLEYFKKKGIDIVDKNFVTGTYMIKQR
jgi:hypothetical protein